MTRVAHLYTPFFHVRGHAMDHLDITVQSPLTSPSNLPVFILFLRFIKENGPFHAAAETGDLSNERYARGEVDGEKSTLPLAFRDQKTKSRVVIKFINIIYMHYLYIYIYID